MVSKTVRAIALALACLLAACVSGGLAAGAAQKPAAEPVTIPWGPYLQNLTPKSVTVVWTANAPNAGLVDYGLSATRLDQHAESRLGTRQAGQAQEVTITGLEPGKVYYYRVTSKAADGREAASSDVGSFATPIPGVRAFTFAVIADTHQSRHAPALAQRLLDEQPHFLLLACDYNKTMDGLLLPYREVLRGIPVYFARGNHDSVARHRQFVAMPGPGDELYYSFRWGNALFIAVDTNDIKGLAKGGRQCQWLENELKNSRDTWRFVFQHFPVYSAWCGRMDPRLDDERQLLEKYDVDVVFQGHMHNYDRSYPLRDRKAVAPGEGVVYITASGGCGGYERFPHPHRPWFIAKQWRGEPFVGLCTINDKRATIQFVTARGLLFETVELHAR